ncbi:MAG: heme A synthase [Rhodospirillales bacterium]|nr:heme A synthase [Rhodospirillales bacterium]
MCAMVFAMVVLGGLTRLTHSGLSMVNWEPVTGWLPPMTPQEWHAAFAGYQLTPEYREINAGMTVDEFKGIFWLEFIHRLVGRSIGVAFLLPFVFFLMRGWINRRSIPVFTGFFILGGLQGVLGWYMVKSGLVDEPDVSQYRLAAHLGLAVVIYAAMFRYALRLRHGYEAVRPVLADKMATTRRGVLMIVALIFVTLVSGGFVAGLNAGMIYNTFPLMDGRLIPHGLYGDSPAILSAFDDHMTVQFNHRVLAVFTVCCVIIFWLLSMNSNLTPRQRSAYNILVLAGLGQVALGISTLLLVVPVALAALHQAGAVIFLSAALFTLHTLEWNRNTS